MLTFLTLQQIHVIPRGDASTYGIGTISLDRSIPSWDAITHRVTFFLKACLCLPGAQKPGRATMRHGRVLTLRRRPVRLTVVGGEARALHAPGFAETGLRGRGHKTERCALR